MWMCVSIECNLIHLKIDTERCHTVIKSSSYVEIRVHCTLISISHNSAEQQILHLHKRCVSCTTHSRQSTALHSDHIWIYRVMFSCVVCTVKFFVYYRHTLSMRCTTMTWCCIAVHQTRVWVEYVCGCVDVRDSFSLGIMYFVSDSH